MLFILCFLMGHIQDVAPLPAAHAHNDYAHPHPLFDALSQGFCSVEADIFLTEGSQLLVGHSKSELKPERTLVNLYLQPLRERIRKNHGQVYSLPAGVKVPVFYLLIDIKTESADTYPVLHKLLTEYADILTEVRDGKVIERAVTVVLSGSRPSLATLGRQSPRFAGYDGRLSDLGSDVPAHLMPWVSDNWALKISWNGNGVMPEKERDKLNAYIKQAHEQNRKIRFWGAPDKEPVWQVQWDSKVDLINTDRLADLKLFLLSHMK